MVVTVVLVLMVAPVVLVKPVLTATVVQGILQAAAVVERHIMQRVVTNITAVAVAVAVAGIVKLRLLHSPQAQY
jgi:hypothetical protein